VDKNKISPSSETVATVKIVSQICQGQPLTMYWKMLQTSSKLVHFWWS